MPSVRLLLGRWQDELSDAQRARLVVLDPPYGQTECDWDVRPDLTELAEAVERWTLPAATIVVFAIQPFATDVVHCWRRWFRYDLIWYKRMPVGFLNARRMPLRSHEHLLVFSRNKSAAFYRPQLTPCRPYRSQTSTRSPIYGQFAAIETMRTRHYPRSVLQPRQQSRSENIHPTEKPLELVEWLIRTFTRRGELVIDPYSGSGVTAAACQELGRQFLGTEADRSYHSRAMARLRASA